MGRLSEHIILKVIFRRKRDTSSSSIRVQTHYQNRVLRFAFGALKTNNVFEKLSAASVPINIKSILTFVRLIWILLPRGSWRRNACGGHSLFIIRWCIHMLSRWLNHCPHRGYDYQIGLDVDQLMDSLWMCLCWTLQQRHWCFVVCPSEQFKRMRKVLKCDDWKVRCTICLWTSWESMVVGARDNPSNGNVEKIWRNVLEGMVWEDPKRQRQVAWFLNTLYTPSQAGDSRDRTAVLQDWGWVTSPGILYHRDFVWNAVQNMDLDLKMVWLRWLRVHSTKKHYRHGRYEIYCHWVIAYLVAEHHTGCRNWLPSWNGLYTV